jgi:phosphate-selective porin OprO/OprP
MKTHLSVAVVLVLACAGPASAQTKSFDLRASGAAGRALAQDRRGLVWDDRPSIVFGEDVNVDLRAKLQFDWRKFDPQIDEETFDFRTARVALKGDLTRHFDFEIERAIETEGSGFGEWKDVYLNWSTFDELRVKAGRFKMPFGLEQNTGATDIDFAYRSLASSTIAPGRDRGVMVYGEISGNDLTYEFGVFDDDGDNGELKEPQFVQAGEDLKGVGPSYAGRLTANLLKPLPVADRLKSMRFGLAYTTAQIPEGLNSLRGQSIYGTEDFFEPVYVKGRRQRFGAQFDWTPGPTGFKAEWMQSREQRIGQSNRNQDLSDFIGTGWYASATWFVTGEDKDDNINPKNPLFQGGIGAIEIGARYDQLEFTSASKTGIAFTNPRSEHLLSNSDKIWTLGVNWMWNRWSRVIANAAHETFDDPSRTPLAGTDKFWSGLIRLQVVF